MNSLKPYHVLSGYGASGHDANVDNIADRMEDRERRQQRYGGILRGRGIGSVRLKYRKGGSGPRERVFAQAWVRERGMLSRLLAPYPTTDTKTHDRWHHVTQREAEVAATLIQWLGSNVGWCFLNQVVSALGYEIVDKKTGRRV